MGGDVQSDMAPGQNFGGDSIAVGMPVVVVECLKLRSGAQAGR